MKKFIAGIAVVAAIVPVIALQRSSAAADKLSPGYACPLDPTLTCVMSGLDSPRGLAFGPEGALYVAEAGRGAGPVTGQATDPRCFNVSTGGRFCYGPTGAITRLWRGSQQRVATGLPSFAFPGQANRGMGPEDIAFLGRGDAYITIGLESDPRTRDDYSSLPELAQFGTLVHMDASGGWQIVADLGKFEIDHNGDGGAIDTDPYGLLVEPNHIIVADAGANDLVRIDANREISLLATFPSRVNLRPSGVTTPAYSDAVPTTVARGPDGAYYIGELVGMPFKDGMANIYRLDPETDSLPRAFTVGDAFLTGFKTIIAIAFDEDGTLYVLQYSTSVAPATTGMNGPGILVRVVPDKSQSDIASQYRMGTRTIMQSNLLSATGLVIGPDDALYVSIRGISPGGGEVVRIAK